MDCSKNTHFFKYLYSTVIPVVVQTSRTGFPKKDARFLKIQNITNLLSDDSEGKIMKDIEF